MRNEAARQRARPRAEPVSGLEEGQGADDERMLATADRADLHAALGDLPIKERLLIRLRYGEDLTQEAIARLLRVPEGTVKVRLHRARVKLHRALEES